MVSDVFLEVNHYNMKPLDEYMLFTKTGSEEVNVMNSQGIRSAQCAFFDVMHKPRPGPSLNISLVLLVLLNDYVFKPGIEEFLPLCCSDLE